MAGALRRLRGPRAAPAGPHHRLLAQEFLAYFDTGGVSNGPTEAMNLLIKKIKRVGHGFRNFENYRLRLLLLLRSRLAHSTTNTTQKPATTLGCVEPVNGLMHWLRAAAIWALCPNPQALHSGWNAAGV